MKKLTLFWVVSAVLAPSYSAATLLSSPSLSWTIIGDGYDSPDDRLVGGRAVELVGTAKDPGFLTRYLLGETSAHLAMRLRFDGTNRHERFSRVVLVGVDANDDGAIDLFLAANQQGAKNFIGIYGLGDTPNDRFGATTINPRPYYQEEITVLNYDYRPVDDARDGGTTDDLGTNQTDYYLSFAVPFEAIVKFLGTQQIRVDEHSTFQVFAATATHSTSINNDIFGFDGSITCNKTWKELGVLAPVGSLHEAQQAAVVPESTSYWAGVFLIGGLLRRRSR